MPAQDRCPEPAAEARPSPAARARSLGVRFAIMAVLWIVLAGFDTKTWPLAVAIVGVAAYASLRTVPPGSFRLSGRGIVRFLPFFLILSARGGFDVAARALRPSPRLDVGTVGFTTVLPPGAPRTFFVAVIGLQPGTLTARLEGDRLRVHVLDRRVDVDPQLRAVEANVAALFGISIPNEGRGNAA